MSNELRKFETNKTYSTASICDSECIFSFEILKRTAKTVKVKVDREIVTRRIFIDYDNCEAFKPFGNYSMAAVIRANKTVDETPEVEEEIEEVKVVETKREYPELKLVETKTELVEINKDNLERNQTIESVEDRSDENIKRMLITFKNGYKLSIIRGMGTYGAESGLFEIAPMNNSGKFNKSLFDKNDRGDNVLGYCDVKKVELYIYKIGNKIKNIKEL
jgi:hypothetical protein